MRCNQFLQPNHSANVWSGQLSFMTQHYRIQLRPVVVSHSITGCTRKTLDDCGDSHDTALKSNSAHQKQISPPHRHRLVATQTSQVTTPYTESISGNVSVSDSATPTSATASNAAKPAPVFEWTKCWWPAIPSKSRVIGGNGLLCEEVFWR